MPGCLLRNRRAPAARLMPEAGCSGSRIPARSAPGPWRGSRRPRPANSSNCRQNGHRKPMKAPIRTGPCPSITPPPSPVALAGRWLGTARSVTGPAGRSSPVDSFLPRAVPPHVLTLAWSPAVHTVKDASSAREPLNSATGSSRRFSETRCVPGRWTGPSGAGRAS
jgi:hypothetical protein